MKKLKNQRLTKVQNQKNNFLINEYYEQKSIEFIKKKSAH